MPSMLKFIRHLLLLVGFISFNLSAQQIIRTNTSVNTANEEPGAIRVSAEGLDILGSGALLTIEEPQDATVSVTYSIEGAVDLPAATTVFIEIESQGAIFGNFSGALPSDNIANLQFFTVVEDFVENSSRIVLRVIGDIPAGTNGGVDLDFIDVELLNIINPENVTITGRVTEITREPTAPFDVIVTIVDEAPSLDIQGFSVTSGLSVAYQINRELAENDVVELTFEGATISNDSVPLLEDVFVTNTSAFSFLSFNNSSDDEPPSSTLRFRALEEVITFSSSNPRRNFNLSGVTLERVASSSVVTLSARTLIPGTEIFFNEVGPTAILDVRSQFALGDGSGVMNRRFNSVIDVDNLRQQFIEASDPGAVTNGGTREPESVVRDDFFVSIDSVQTDLLNTTVTSAQLSLTGEDLNFLLDANGNLEGARFDVTGLDGATVIGAGNDASNFEDNTLTVATANNPGGYVGIALLPEGVNEDSLSQLSSQRFLADLEVRYALGGTAGSVDRGNIDAGAWTLNGTTFNIPFMPYGPAFNQVIAISNGGNVSGSIELMAFSDNGEQIGPLTLSNVATANTVTNISASIREALEDELGENFDANGAEFDITLIVNSSFDDVDMSANYRVNNDRVGVIVIKE